MAQVYTKTGWVDDVTPVSALNLNNMEGGIFLASAPIVTTLPSSPVDGQECNYLADATNGIVWHLIYRSTSGKWHMTGGPALYANVDGNSVVNARSYANFGGPSLTVPLAGDYEVTYGGRAIADVGAGGHSIQAAIAVNGTVQNGNDAIDSYSSGSNNALNTIITRIKTGLTAGTVLSEVAQSDAGNAGLNQRWLRAMPRRVG